MTLKGKNYFRHFRHYNQNIQYAKKRDFWKKINLISALQLHPCLHYYWMTSEDSKLKLLSIKVPQSFSIPLWCNGVSWTSKTYFQLTCEIYAILMYSVLYIESYILKYSTMWEKLANPIHWPFSLIYKLHVVSFDIIIIPQKSKMASAFTHYDVN